MFLEAETTVRRVMNSHWYKQGALKVGPHSGKPTYQDLGKKKVEDTDRSREGSQSPPIRDAMPF
jgi:hypothetical protein